MNKIKTKESNVALWRFFHISIRYLILLYSCLGKHCFYGFHWDKMDMKRGNNLLNLSSDYQLFVLCLQVLTSLSQ